MQHKKHHYAKDTERVEEEVGGYMTTPVISIDSQTNIHELTQVMDEKNVGSLLVTNGSEYIGIVTERDLSRKVLRQKMDPETTKVNDIMSAPIMTLEGSRPVTEANQFMADKKIRHLAVTDAGKIVGMLSVKDLVSFFANPRMRY
jgi:signal-transduction protein with cAMP-binding, CBS, and nucleotidyltransferase domain